MWRTYNKHIFRCISILSWNRTPVYQLKNVQSQIVQRLAYYSMQNVLNSRHRRYVTQAPVVNVHTTETDSSHDEFSETIDDSFLGIFRRGYDIFANSESQMLTESAIADFYGLPIETLAEKLHECDTIEQVLEVCHGASEPLSIRQYLEVLSKLTQMQSSMTVTVEERMAIGELLRKMPETEMSPSELVFALNYLHELAPYDHSALMEAMLNKVRCAIRNG